MDLLNDPHLAFLMLIIQHPGAKFNGGQAYDNDSNALWPALEERGLIKCVGSFKWEPTESCLIIAKSAFSPILQMSWFSDILKANENQRLRIETLEGDCEDQRRMKERAREQRGKMSETLGVRRARIKELEAELEEAKRADTCWAAVVKCALDLDTTEDGIQFLRTWNEGDFDGLREFWPEAPEEAYWADPLYKGPLQSTSNAGEKVYPGCAEVPEPEGGAQVLDKGEQVTSISDVFPLADCPLCYDVGHIAIDDPVNAPITTAPCPACRKDDPE